MAFNGSSGGGGGGGDGNGSADGPHGNKRLCTGQNADINDGHAKTRVSENLYITNFHNCW